MLPVWAWPWIMGGDFNGAANELRRPGCLRLVGGVVFAPKAATYSNRTTDYFVVSKDFTHAVKGVRVVGDTGNAPHRTVRILLSSRARLDAMRILRDIPK